MPKRSRSRKKNRTHVAAASSTPDGSTNPEKVPKSLIVRRGKTCHEMDELVNDMRRMMLPYTAMNYQDTNTTKSKKISLQQYSTGIALPMGITHIIQLSQSSSGTASSNSTSTSTGTTSTSNHQENHDYCNMRIARVPEGPVLYFRIHQFTLIRHIQSIQRKPIALNTTSITNHSPIVVTNNFGDHTASSHIKLLRITFQNLFPQINVSTIKLRDCRRVVLFNLIETTTTSNNTSDDTHNTIQVIEMRHYAVKATPLGMNRKVRRILEVAKKTNKAPPNLHNVHDIADYITNQSTSLSMNGSTTSSINTANSNNNNDVMSDSEPEDDVEHHVTLPDTYVGVGNVAKQTSALKLVEIGPRLSLQLLKVEKGLSDTNKIVLYNVHVTKSKEEIESKQNEINRTLQIKEERKRQQEQNVEQKRIIKERKLQQKQLKIQQQTQESGDGMVDTENNIQSNNTMVHDRDSSDDDDDDDEDAYKIEGVSSSDDEENDGNDNDEDEMDDNE